MKIKYNKCNPLDICLVPCPYNIRNSHDNEVKKVGSSGCDRCTHQESNNNSEHYIICNHTLETA